MSERGGGKGPRREGARAAPPRARAARGVKRRARPGDAPRSETTRSATARTGPARTGPARTGTARSAARDRPGAKRTVSRSARRFPRAGSVSVPDAPSQKLHKMLAQAGLGSRRTMEQWIGEGRVTVNGAVARIGARVSPGDAVHVGREIVRWPGASRLPRVLLYHKPEGEIVTQSDPEGRTTVFERLPSVRGAKWVAIGRLDYNTSGLLMFTTSGELANRMTHPRFAVEREYAVRIVGQLAAAQLERLSQGIELSDGSARCERVDDAGGEGTNHWYRLVVREGRNRVVRRMFEALGLTVSRLIRVRFGEIALPPQLKRGQIAPLPAPDVKRLLAWLEQAPPQAPPRAPRASR